MSKLLSERIVLTDSRSLLDIRGGENDAVLLIEGRPLLYHWSDCEGSIGQYLIYTMQPPAALKSVSPRIPFPTISYPDDSLREYLAPLLETLAPDEYVVEYLQAPDSFEVVEFDDHWDVNTDSSQFYPGPVCFVATQSLSRLDESRVAEYTEQIQMGLRPALITISVKDGECNFVIDGHHKLAAYSRLGVAPQFVSICRQNPPKITSVEAMSYVPVSHPLHAKCREVREYFG